MSHPVTYKTAAKGRRPARRRGGLRPHAEALESRQLLASTLSLGDASVVEGHAGAVDLVFPVTRTGDLDTESTVGYTTADGTATAGSDYTAVPAGGRRSPRARRRPRSASRSPATCGTRPTRRSR